MAPPPTHAHVCATWLIHMCDMLFSCVWHNYFICVTWFIHGASINPCGMCVRKKSLICVMFLIHACDSFMCVTHPCVRLIHVWHSFMSRSCVRLIHVCDSFMCVTLIHALHSFMRETHSCAWLFHVCDTTYSYVCHDSFMAPPPSHAHVRATWLTYMCDVYSWKLDVTYSARQPRPHCNIPQHTPAHCNTAAPYCNTRNTVPNTQYGAAQRTNALQHRATPCNTLQHTATRRNTPDPAPRPPQRPAHIGYVNTLQHTAT